MGTIGQADFSQRVAAAAACGHAAVSVLPADCLSTSPERLRALAAAKGIHLAALDPLTTWIPGWSPRPGWTDNPERMAFAESFAVWEVDEALRTATALGCTSVSLIEPYGRPVPLDRGAEAFASVCDRVADCGLQVALESMPFSGVPDLASAWSIVHAAGRGNGRLVLDTWHFFRSGGDLGVLTAIPADRLSVQLCDAPARPEPDLYREMLDRRLLPGEGDLDLRTVVDLLYERGFDGTIGPEVMSADLRALDPVEAARRAADACRVLLDGPTPA